MPSVKAGKEPYPSQDRESGSRASVSVHNGLELKIFISLPGAISLHSTRDLDPDWVRQPHSGSLLQVQRDFEEVSLLDL